MADGGPGDNSHVAHKSAAISARELYRVAWKRVGGCLLGASGAQSYAAEGAHSSCPAAGDKGAVRSLIKCPALDRMTTSAIHQLPAALGQYAVTSPFRHPTPAASKFRECHKWRGQAKCCTHPICNPLMLPKLAGWTTPGRHCWHQPAAAALPPARPTDDPTR